MTHITYDPAGAFLEPGRIQLSDLTELTARLVGINLYGQRGVEAYKNTNAILRV